MRTLVVGIGALGGLIAARLRAAGSPVWLATRNAESAARLKASGLRVTGVGGAVSVETVEVAPLDEYLTGSRFDLIVLATKAHDAIEVASKLSGCSNQVAPCCRFRTAVCPRCSGTGSGNPCWEVCPILARP